MEQFVLNVGGIKCEVCEASIQKKLEDSGGVETAVADSNNNTVEITYDPDKIDIKTLKKIIIEHGLEIIN